MANDKKFVVKRGLATPNVDFANGGGSISATFLSTSNTLSFSGNTGQLFSITDSMSGTIFSVNDISGIPSIEVIDTGSVKIAETFGTVAVGANTLSNYKFYVSGNTLFGNSVTLNSTLIANGTVGTSGFVLTSNGTGVYWANSAATNVANATFATTSANTLALQGATWQAPLGIGTVTANTGAFTSLTVSANVNIDSGTLFTDATTNRVGIGTITPTTGLHVQGSALITNSAYFGPNTAYGIQTERIGNINYIRSIGAAVGSTELQIGSDNNSTTKVYAHNGNIWIQPGPYHGWNDFRFSATQSLKQVMNFETTGPADHSKIDYTFSNNYSANISSKIVHSINEKGSWKPYLTALSDTGNVSIGSNTTPGQALHVTGSVGITSGIVANGSFGTNGHVLTSNGTAIYWAAANSSISSIANANNASFLNGRIWETAGAIGATVANTGAFTILTISGNTVHNGNSYFNGGIIANGSFGTSGQVLTSNGTASYWANTSAGGFTGNTVSANSTIIRNQSYNVNAAAGWVTMSLPSTVATGDIFIVHSQTGNTRILNNSINIMDVGTGNDLVLESGETVWLQAVNATAVDILFTYPAGGTPAVVANSSFATNANNSLFANSASFVYGKQESQLSVAASNTALFLQNRTWETAGAIGATVANTGAFTTISTTGNIQQQNANYLNGRNSSGGSTRLFGINSANTLYVGAIDTQLSETLFVNNGVEQMRIQSSGNVSIGSTTTPTRLFVNGHMSLANGFGIYANGTLGANGLVLTSNGTSLFWGSIAAAANATFSTTANNALFANSASFVYGKQESQLSVANAVYAQSSNSANFANAAAWLGGFQSSYYTNATNITTGTLPEAQLPFRMNQNVRTTDNVTFANLTITGSVTVTGNVTTWSSNNLNITDNMIYLNSNSQVANPDLGFAANYNDGTYRHTGFFRDATDGVWKVFDQYLPEPDASAFIDTANASFRIADFQANVVNASSVVINNAQAYRQRDGTGTVRTLLTTLSDSSVVINGFQGTNMINGVNGATYHYGSGGGGGSIAMTILTGGNIGIGNTTPGQRLQVDGSVGIKNGLVANGSFGNDGHVLTSNGTAIYWAAANANISSISSANNASFLQTRTWESPFSIGSTVANTGAFTSLTASANVNLDSGTLFVDSTNNRVGINNTNPTTSLHVQGNALIGGDGVSNYDFKLQRLNSGIRAVQHDFAAAANSPWILHGENLSWTGERSGTVESTQAFRPYYEAFAPAVGYKEFGFANVTSGNFTGTNLIPNLVLTGTGRVGVGTTNPITPFVVSNAGAGGLEFDGSTGLIQSYNRGTSAYQTMLFDAATIVFRPSGTEAARITATGNVAIGSTDAPTKLFVNGHMSVANGFGIFANGVLGANGLVLTSNGTSLFWGSVSAASASTANNASFLNGRIWETAGAIGATVANTGAFTRASTTNGLADNTGTGGILRLNSPGGASYGNNTPVVNGAIKIKLPVAANNSGTMMRMTVKFYDYNGSASGTSRTIDLGGYNYTDGNWYNYFATQTTMGGSDVNVRFGYDGTGNCIWIGDTNSTWSYPQIFVTDFQGGFGNFTHAIWGSGWTISAVTAFDTVVAGPIIAAKQLTSQNFNSYALGISGTAANAALLNSQNAAFYTDIPARLGFTPVQQGGGTGQSTNKLYIGWSNTLNGSASLRLTVDSTDFGNTWPINISGTVSGTVATANNASFLAGRRWETAGAIGSATSNTGAFTTLTTNQSGGVANTVTATSGQVISYTTMNGGRTYYGYDLSTQPSLYEARFVNIAASTNIPSGMSSDGYWFGMGAGDTANRGFSLMGTTSNGLWYKTHNGGSWVRTVDTTNIGSLAANNASYLAGRIWETAGAIGSTVANTGAFTTLNVRPNQTGAIAAVQASNNSIGMYMVPNAGSGAYNNLVSAGDNLIYFSNNTINGGNLVIGSWTDRASGYGIRFSNTYAVAVVSNTFTMNANTIHNGNSYFNSGIFANGAIGANGLVLTSNGNGVFWGSVSAGGTTTNAVTFNNSGSGDASGTTFNGSAARTISYNTVGAPSTTGTGASGTWGISISGISTATSGQLQGHDIRTISPSSITTNRAQFGFTSFNNNNTSPYADFFHLRSYTDASGGNDNLVMFRKDAIGMRIYQQTYGSATAYSSFKDIAFTDGTNASGTWGINVTGSSASVVQTVTGTTSAELVRGNMGDNDQARILVGATATNAGFLEIATADDGTEPIHVRQYTGVFSTIARTATLLDGSGNTSFPGAMSLAAQLTVTGARPLTYASSAGSLTIQGDSGGWATGTYFLGSGGANLGGFGGYGGGNALTYLWAGTDYASPAIEIYTTGQYAQSPGSFRAPIFYDSNNTAYYMNPLGTTNLLGNLYVARDGTSNDTFGGLEVREYSYAGAATGAANEAPGINFHWGSRNAARIYMNGSGHFVFAGQSDITNNRRDIIFASGYAATRVDAPIFRDSDNTAFYFDGASTTNINTMSGNGKTMFETADTYLRINQGSSFSNGTWFGGVLVRADGVYAGSNGGTTNSRVYMSSGTYNGTNVIALDGSNGRITALDIRSAIFYDTDNTGFYVNPAGDSVLNRTNTYLAGKDVNTNWNTGFSNTPTQSYNFHGDVSSGGPAGTWWFYESMRHSNGAALWGTQIAWGWEDNANRLQQRNISNGTYSGWVEYLNTSDRTYSGNLYMTGSIRSTASDMRAPIFYDQDNTSYYGNFAGTSYINALNIGPTAGGSSYLNINGNNGYGGTNYHGFLTVNNTGASSNPQQYWRLNPSGGFEIVNNAYSSVLFTFTQGGDFTAAGNVTAYSDRKLKDNFEPISDAVNKVLKLNGVTFTRIDKDDTTQRYAGLIAQDVEPVLPEAVQKNDTMSYGEVLSVDYNGTIALLVEAIKEQQAHINRLEQQINSKRG